MSLIAAPTAGGIIHTRTFIPRVCHAASGVLGAVSVATACIIPGNARVHPRNPGQVAHRLMPNSEYHEVFAEDRMDVDVAFEDWEKKEGLLAAIFIDFLRRQGRS